MRYDNIRFFSENIPFKIKKKTALRNWIYDVVNLEKKLTGNINFIFCSDQFLYQFNKEYLHHNYLTDVITFDYNNGGDFVSGDIYISIERIKENAKKYGVRMVDELHRVMIHGVLHLMKYLDETPEKKALMHQYEDKYLTLRPNKL